MFSREASTPNKHSDPSQVQVVSTCAVEATTQTLLPSPLTSNEHLDTNTLGLPSCNFQFYPHEINKYEAAIPDRVPELTDKCEAPIPISVPEHSDLMPKSASDTTTLTLSHNMVLAQASNEHLETNSSGLPPCNYQVYPHEIKKEALYRFIPLPVSRTPTPSQSLSDLHNY